MEGEQNIEEMEEITIEKNPTDSLVLLKSLTKRVMKEAIGSSYHVNVNTVSLMDKLASAFLINLGSLYLSIDYPSYNI